MIDEDTNGMIQYLVFSYLVVDKSVRFDIQDKAYLRQTHPQNLWSCG